MIFFTVHPNFLLRHLGLLLQYGDDVPSATYMKASVSYALRDVNRIVSLITNPDLSRGDVVALSGELGAGKTTLATNIVRLLVGEDCLAMSPTYQIIRSYRCTSGLELAHIDLYRIRTMQEALGLGIEEILDNGITLIEWPELLHSAIASKALFIHIEHVDCDTRKAKFSTANARWEGVINGITAMI
jgi:tRNA threonylcarbamoyladenosine biosynthesis protein TsaE